MPLPKPREGEEKNDYIPRCIRFVYRESTRHRPRPQIAAMCIANWERFHQKGVTMQATPTFRQLGNALLIEGDLLAPGTFIGLDGVPTHYGDRFIHRVAPSIIGKPIKFAHDISPKSMLKRIQKGTTIGFWTGYKKGETLKVRGYTFDPIAIEYLKTHPHIGLSMEAKVYAEYSPKLGVEDAKSGMLTGGVLIDDPACPTCRVTTVREVSLGDRIEKMKGVLNVSAEELEELEEEEEEEGEEELTDPDTPFFETKDLAKGTRKEFFTWLETELRGAKLEDKIVKAILKVLRKAIKTPVAIPAPKAKAMETAGEETALAANELWDKVKAKLKAAGIDEAVISKVVSALRGLIRTPYPYAKAQEELVKQLAEMRAELKILQDEREAIRTKAYEEALTKVKSFDKDFDEKILESLECIDAKRVFLERYLATLKRTTKPIQLQIGKTKAETSVQGAVEEMFGDQTFEQIFDLPVKKEGE